MASSRYFQAIGICRSARKWTMLEANASNSNSRAVCLEGRSFGVLEKAADSAAKVAPL